MPSTYAVLTYARVNQIVEKLAPASEQAALQRASMMALAEPI